MTPHRQVRMSAFASTAVRQLASIGLAIVASVTWAASAAAQTVAAGSAHTAVITPGGTVWTWGSNGANQLGLGPGATSRKVPTQVTALSSVVVVAVARATTSHWRSIAPAASGRGAATAPVSSASAI